MERYGDMRLSVVSNIRQMWTAVKENALGLISGLVHTIYNLQRQNYEPGKQLSVDVYFDLLLLEHKTTGQLNDVERTTIDALYDIANLQVGNALMSRLYENLQSKLCASSELKQEGARFLAFLQNMYSLMSRLLTLPDTPVFEDERNDVALQIIQYLKKQSIGLNRKQMFTQYVSYLVDLHISLKNYTEAGMAHLEQLRVLDWSDHHIQAVKPYPAEAEKTRKERLYKLAIAAFSSAEDYERAITLCSELRHYYQFQSYDYNKVSITLQQQAELFQQVIKAERYYPVYFRVVYYGDGFDSAVRGKEFVYRGDKLEAIMDFTNRFKLKFPDAKIQMSSDAPKDEALAASKQIISITKLNPVPNSIAADIEEKSDMKLGRSKPTNLKTARLTMRRGQCDAVPTQIESYWDNTDLRVLEYSKAVQKALEKKPANEFKHLWINRVFLIVDEPFPTTKRRQLVSDTFSIEMTPIENAIEAILAKTRELKDKYKKVQAGTLANPVDSNPLAMCLGGITDAAVNGGTKLYIEAFVGPDFLSDNPGEKFVTFQNQLKAALREQVTELEAALKVYKIWCDEKMQGFFDHLTNTFAKMSTLIIGVAGK